MSEPIDRLGEFIPDEDQELLADLYNEEIEDHDRLRDETGLDSSRLMRLLNGEDYETLIAEQNRTDLIA